MKEETSRIIKDSSNEQTEKGTIEVKLSNRLYMKTLRNALSSIGAVEPSLSQPINVEAKEKLTRLYIKQLALDVKPRVRQDPNFDQSRFPAT
eukprot:CAMPEP_0171464292 /NCGR_PEP_ID=MMETSP0945-20130129/7652_1 /TAXON_ID=109269 /ORGANISM="Vaucheria litorea, Strain CCMP2940" /LENGTH=91 /DNA_ID=CAMNT_0011991317 /DNA_START=56 /DNA_END=328 /DNA_ORIENTATION=-